MNLLRGVTITDETGTRYNDLFADLTLDDYELLEGPAGVRGVDAVVPARAYGPRAGQNGPLDALLLRWAQAHGEQRRYVISWQYIDAHDIHTIAIADTRDRAVTFVNIFGRVAGGRRSYRLREIADALDLLIEPDFRSTP